MLCPELFDSPCSKRGGWGRREVKWGKFNMEAEREKKGKPLGGKPASQICIGQSEARYESALANQRPDMSLQ